jgi:hypothetical protein
VAGRFLCLVRPETISRRLVIRCRAKESVPVSYKVMRPADSIENQRPSREANQLEAFAVSSVMTRS